MERPKSQAEQDWDHLSNIEPFQRFLVTVYSRREQAIADLRQAPDAGKVMEGSGRIQAFDEILVAANWEAIRDRMARAG